MIYHESSVTLGSLFEEGKRLVTVSFNLRKYAYDRFLNG